MNMKKIGWVVFAMLVATMLWGQAAPAPNATAVSQPNSNAQQPGFPSQPMTPIEANSMYLAQLKGMMDQLKAMQSKLDEIKAHTTKVKDPTLKQQLELDNELWAMMLAQLQAIAVSTAQSRSYARFGTAEQAYRQHRQALRQPPVPPAPTTPATPAAPVTSDSKQAAPSDHL
jgi:TolA-binding protein